jgi:hypothetical protein
MFNEIKDFYPTPYNLARRMFEKIETLKCKYLLEPSAGKGDLIEHFKKYYEIKNSRYLGYQNKINDCITIDAIEIDINLSNILRGKGINVVFDDFLNYQPQRFYQTIIANFPFSNGCEHLLKAIEIQERIGGEIICLINSETIRNPYSNNRKQLKYLLDKYNADIEFIEGAFEDAERQTSVSVVMIYISVPMQNDETIFEREFKKDNPDISFKDMQSLAVNRNKLEQLIFECEMIKNSGIELFREKMKIDKLLNDMNLKLKINISDDSYNHKVVTVNDFIDTTNLEYWNKFINETEFRDRLPSKLRTNFSYNMEKQKDIAFNMENVKYFYEKLVESIPQSYEEIVANLLDDLTRKYVYSDSSWNQTIHYFNGWRTNDSFKISKKVIIPCSTGFYFYSLPDTLRDLNIIFENLSGIKDNINEGERVYRAIKNNEKKIETQFFILDSFKKGTLHISFKDQELLNRFNILAAKGKSWLPGDFGTKHYSDMDEEEKNLVKEFGLTIEDYSKLCLSNQRDYLRLTSAN